MCVTREVHVRKRLKLPSCFINLIDSLEVSLGISDAASSDKNLSSHFDRLAVPNVRNAFISEHPLLLRPSLHIEEDYIVVIEEMQAHLSELYLNHRPYGSRYLFFVVKFAENLELQALSLTEVTQNYRDAVGLRKALEKSLLFHCKVPLALIKMRIV
jgi:hypothetical protein